ncbi:molybdate ABC transporter substrate-binding protein [Oryzobacter telluris]|uniref:molybdate ABC transporter substrate-binding protein n=1 Tax=Oryzobacter telluris TaxID=3149179 RepID=UPI00370D285B
MKRRATGLVAGLALLLAGCGATPTDTASSGSPAGSSSTTSSAVTGEVTVLAAASLTKTLTALAESFEEANPGATIRLSFGSSTTLAQQIAQGAEADLFASAGTTALEQLGDVKPTDTATIAKNTLEIATPTDNPGKVTGLADLARADVDVVLCAESVPCGTAADQVLTKAGVAAHVVSREVDVSATLAKVTLGEADAAVVYHSDVVSARGKVAGVEIPAEQNTTLAYPLARFGDDAAARAFAAFLAGPDGLKALQDAGFLSP